MNLLARSLAGVVAVAAFGSATAEEFTLTVHHFLGPKSPTHRRLIAPWKQRVEKASNRRIKVEVFPSMSMGGKPPELYRQLRDGAADVVWTLIGYSPGVFPRSEVFELPTVHGGSAKATTLAIQEMFDMVAEDYKDVKVLLLHAHQGNAIHTTDKAVKSIQDVRGLKLRTPSRTGAWMIEAWNAEPVGMPIPALPQALAKGTVDGALVPFEIFPPFKLQQLTKYTIEGPKGARFGTSVFLFAMNKERYESMPTDLRAVIDANSGAAIAEAIGQVWVDIEKPGMDLQINSNGQHIELDAKAFAEFNKRGQMVVDRWVTEVTGKGIDGAKLVKTARAAVARHSQ